MFDFLFPIFKVESPSFVQVDDESLSSDETTGSVELKYKTGVEIEEDDESLRENTERAQLLAKENFDDWKEEMDAISQIRNWWIRGFFLLIMLLLGVIFGLYAVGSNLFKTRDNR